MSTHHRIMKIVIVTGVMALLTAISQWNEHYRMNKLEKALIHLQENDMLQDSVLLQVQAKDQIDSVVWIYEHS